MKSLKTFFDGAGYIVFMYVFLDEVKKVSKTTNEDNVMAKISEKLVENQKKTEGTNQKKQQSFNENQVFP